MATAQQVKTVGTAVRDALQAKIDSGDYPNDLQRMMMTHAVFTRRLSAFAVNPAHGEASPAYDAALLAEQNAGTAVANCSPQNGSSIDTALAATALASKALAAVTAPSFSSALAVRRPPRPGSGGVVIAAAGGDDPVPPPAPNTEPYLTSLAKLFPAEALSALLLVLAIDKDDFASQRNILIGIIALASGVLRYLSSQNPNTERADILAVFVSVVSFLIYAVALNAFGPLFHTDEPTTRIIATVVAILWMGILTQVVRKAPAP